MVAEKLRVLVIGMRPAGDDEALRITRLDQTRELALDRPVPRVATQAEDVDVTVTIGREELLRTGLEIDRIQPFERVR